METVTSNDGTEIAFWRTGNGPPLVLVHGALADHETAWCDIAGELSQSFTVLAMDRRGRGASGEPQPHSIEQAYDDIAAVIDAAGEQVDVLGHSYGANLVLGAALRSERVRRLVLYEAQPKSKPDPERADTLDAFLEAGDFDGFFATFFGVPPQRAGRLRANPKWDEWVKLARATAADRRAFANYVLEPEMFRGLSVPVLFLVGEKSPAAITDVSQRLAAAIPDSRTAVLVGQGHFAMNSAPGLFCAEVIPFLNA